MSAPIWQPSPESVAGTSIVRFAKWLRSSGAHPLEDVTDYLELWRWSVADPGAFWKAVAEFFGIGFGQRATTALEADDIEHARWFPGATLNYAREMLDGHEGTAVIAVTEDGAERELTYEGLRGLVGALQRHLRESGVQSGDVVVGYLTNGPEALIGLLACATEGVVWAQCAPDYSAQAAIDRFAQLKPVALIAVTEYRFGGRSYDRTAEVRMLRDGLPTVRTTIVTDHPVRIEQSLDWHDIVARPAEPMYTDVQFEHPLWVLFTSGTTGTPKGIVHGHGGIVLEELAFCGLHFDQGSGDRLLWYSSTNWVMWNISVSCLLLGATAVLYDGSPAHPGADRLWEVASRHRVKVFGTSPGYLALSAREMLEPAAVFDLSALRIIGSTGSILPATSYTWVRDHIGPRVQVNSISGGTDIAGGFAGSAPTTPVWAGELSAPSLGAAIAAWDSEGRAVQGTVGELAVLRPMPSMPVRLWNDPDGERYHAAYFADLPGAWRQGDWITVTPRNSVVMHGRSDATLNRQGVRLGTADIYRVVEQLQSVVDSLVLGIELPDGGYWMPLFIVEDGTGVIDDAELRDAVRSQASPRHVPDDIIRVGRLPHTKTGKKLEVPLKRILQGAPQEQTLSAGAVDDIEAVAEVVAAARSTGKVTA